MATARKHLLAEYLSELATIRATGMGVKETSYYQPLSNLLNDVGKELKPRVRSVFQLANRGAGSPDAGLFTPDQIQKSKSAQPLLGQVPSRGVIEVKGTNDDAWVTSDGPQVTKYWGVYGQVLVTNLRDFVMVGRDSMGMPAKLETYRLAADEKAFWALTRQPAKADAQHGVGFIEYLQRVMLQTATLTAPKDLAWLLASYARDARSRIEGAKLPALASVRAALEQSLGLTFEGQKGDHFFRSTLIQTLFYGMFSAWVLWQRNQPAGSTARFDWRAAAWQLRVPMISALFHQVTDPTKLQPLGLVEVLDWAGAALDRVDASAFFARFERDHAVLYFYEPFLEAFDPELRKDLGVWYTPPEIVSFMVARVDRVLRDELGIDDGLADPNVYVLDPAAGTGSYLVEVLKTVHKSAVARLGAALAAQETKRAATTRIFGFEILPAPFVVSHLQLGLLLQTLGAPLDAAPQERAGVYLTNALTGWQPPTGPKQLVFPALEDERDKAGRVKREVPILVVLGNPPYNGFAGVSPSEEEGLLEPYKAGLKGWGITKNYLDDLYIRFFRVAERRIAEGTGRGIVSFISNDSWTSDPTYVVLREHLLNSFDRFWIESLHGDRQASELAPDGKTSETIFANHGLSVGIQQGVAISLWLKDGQPHANGRVLFRDDLDDARAVDRRARLLASLGDAGAAAHYAAVTPGASSRFSFRPRLVAAGYDDWPNVAELAELDPMLGLNDNRRLATIDMVKASLAARMERYYDPAIDWEEVGDLHVGLVTDAAGFIAKTTRARLVRESKFRKERIKRFLFKPFDLRWAYVERIGNLWNRVRPELLDHAWDGQEFVIVRRRAPKPRDGAMLLYARHLADQHVLHKDGYFVPFRLSSNKLVRVAPAGQVRLPDETDGSAPKVRANLSPAARAYLGAIAIADLDATGQDASLIWLHILALGYAPAYLLENADGIELDWPRVPLPSSEVGLRESARLGRLVADLLDGEKPVPGVTTGKIRDEVAGLGVVTQAQPGPLDLNVTADWGRLGAGGIVTAGQGRPVVRGYTLAERDVIKRGADALGLSLADVLGLIGLNTVDVYLNETTYWTNVPVRAWEYSIAGYQVLKKWLTYREGRLLGRPLIPAEAADFMTIVRRLAALLLLEPQLDANYRASSSAAFNWGSLTASPSPLAVRSPSA